MVPLFLVLLISCFRVPRHTISRIPPTMKTEIELAANFLVELIRTGSSKCFKLTEDQLSLFGDRITEVLTNFYENHWFPEVPERGSAYRCIRNNGKVDPILAKAGHLMGIAGQILHQMFPKEFTMWVDPHEVSYRIGENGSICVLYETKSQHRTPPSPPVTPPNKRIRSSPEPPATPVKILPSLFQQQAVTPPQALSYHQHFSPSNSRRSSPNQHLKYLQQHHLALLKEAAANSSINCKDVLRPNHVLPISERLFVSSWFIQEKNKKSNIFKYINNLLSVLHIQWYREQSLNAHLQPPISSEEHTVHSTIPAATPCK